MHETFIYKNIVPLRFSIVSSELPIPDLRVYFISIIVFRQPRSRRWKMGKREASKEGEGQVSKLDSSVETNFVKLMCPLDWCLSRRCIISLRQSIHLQFCLGIFELFQTIEFCVFRCGFLMKFRLVQPFMKCSYFWVQIGTKFITRSAVKTGCIKKMILYENIF